ncbi:MAG: phosphodiester glycosidase family protein [Deltaproteobacteria bacterium]|nr:phosphodiester glycosidase family protein [Deltaproteobacteria bacterium]
MAKTYHCTAATPSTTLGPVTLTEENCTIGDGDQPDKTVRFVQATFPLNTLSVFDMNIDRANTLSRLEKQFDVEGFKALLTGRVAANPDGGTAVEVLKELPSAVLVVGGIYFATDDERISWLGGDRTRQADGFVFDNGALSYERGNFESGGYLLFDQQGVPSFVPKKEFGFGDLNDKFCSQGHCEPREKYRLVVQSNRVLVLDGHADENRDDVADFASALSANRDGSVSLTVAFEPGKEPNGSGPTPLEFAELLARHESRFAINLDGGPSTQLAFRHRSLGIPNDLVPRKAGSPNRMPQLFVVNSTPFPELWKAVTDDDLLTIHEWNRLSPWILENWEKNGVSTLSQFLEDAVINRNWVIAPAILRKLHEIGIEPQKVAIIAERQKAAETVYTAFRQATENDKRLEMREISAFWSSLEGIPQSDRRAGVLFFLDFLRSHPECSLDERSRSFLSKAFGPYINPIWSLRFRKIEG